MSDNVDPLEQTTAEAMPRGKLVTGAPLGGYQLLDILGEGGMGVVWSARDPLLDRTIAIKVLKHGDAAPALRLRLLREARAMARLKHPNVLTVYEVGTEGERDFIAMELVDGGSLDQWLARDPPRADVVTSLLAAGRGLAAAHAAGLVHRDFKPNNVLRSRDGRVLVTDFGLARGLGDEPAVIGPVPDSPIALATTLESRPGLDSVLHSPLTKTGAMIGTPAYMAPEQYTGSPPDPRTDQFAFCVTAWQALTGARPYHGRTLDELRAAVTAGVGGVVADLAKPVRAVLERGLDPDPAKRWPDLEAMLEAFERACRVQRRRRRWPVAAGAGLAAIIAALVYAGRASSDAAANPCEADKSSFGLGARTELRRYRAAVYADYDAACSEPKPAPARIECLLALRDRAAAVDELPAGTQRDLLLPGTQACDGRVPVAVPAIPTGDSRARVAGVLAKLGTADLEADARATGWPPLVPLVQVAWARTLIARGELAHARELLGRAVPAAESTDPRIAAIARIAQLEVSLVELEHPEAYETTKPDALHEELARLLAYARSAVKLAGDEPVLAGMLALAEGQALADFARSHPRAWPDAMARLADARKRFEAAGDVERAARAAGVEADADLARGELDNAAFAARTASRALDDAALPASAELERIRARVAFARGDLDEAHELYDQVALAPARFDRPGVALAGDARRGTVVGADGKPVMGATVVAWTGELHGDSRRLYTDATTVHGEIVETAADGTFQLHAAPAAAIVAQHGDARSPPRAVGTGAIAIRLAPTIDVTGQIEAHASAARAGSSARPVDVPRLVDAFARFSVGSAAWYLHAPVEDLAFRLRRVPPGAPLYGVTDGVRRITAGAATKLAWPEGTSLDVVARAPRFADGARVWLFHQRAHPATRAEVEALAATSTDLVVAPLERIGARTTDAGRALYAAGDRHAIVTAFDFGSACVAASAEPTAPVECADLEHEPALLVELR